MVLVVAVVNLVAIAAMLSVIKTTTVKAWEIRKRVGLKIRQPLVCNTRASAYSRHKYPTRMIEARTVWVMFGAKGLC